MKCSEYSGETVLSSLGVNIKNEGFYSIWYWPFVMGIHRYLALYEGSPLVPGGLNKEHVMRKSFQYDVATMMFPYETSN